MPRASHFRVSSGVIGVSCALSWAAVVRACPIEVVGTGAARWQGVAATTFAALSEDARLRCASVIVEATREGAIVRLTTRDGRLAVRELQDPVELLPAVQALTEPSVVLEPTASEADQAPPRSAVEPASRPSPAPLEPPQRVRDPYASRPLAAGSMGFRVGADRLITPTVGGSLSLLQPPLELGILARYEAHYVNSSGDNEGRPETSSLAFGTLVGVHREFEQLALRGGLLLLVVMLREEEDAEGGRAEARIGAYVGGVWPARSKLRFRTDLSLDVVPYNIGRSETNVLGESSMPWWGVSFSLGVEVG